METRRAQHFAAQARRGWVSRLEVILKVTERCNLNCSYCYVFNGSDHSFRTRPARLSQDLGDAAAAFLAQGCTELGIEALQVDFHGGEPLLIGKSRFDQLCSTLRRELAGKTNLALAVQTNATIVDPEWVEIFAAHQVSPGVSVDGTPTVNDLRRVDFHGRGTYLRTLRGIELLKEAFDRGCIPSLAVLSVIDPAQNGGDQYRHIVGEIGVATMDFLFPDNTHDSISEPDDGSVGRFLCEVFDAWIEDDDPDVFVRVLASVTSLLLGGRSHLIGFGGEFPAAISIASDGTLGPDDILRSCGQEHFYTDQTVRSTTLTDLLNSQRLLDIFAAGSSVPIGCGGCCWEVLCRGGQLVHRFSKASGFAQRSVYCASLRNLYAHVARYLEASGEITRPDLIELLCSREATTVRD